MWRVVVLDWNAKPLLAKLHSRSVKAATLNVNSTSQLYSTARRVPLGMILAQQLSGELHQHEITFGDRTTAPLIGVSVIIVAVRVAVRFGLHVVR